MSIDHLIRETEMPKPAVGLPEAAEIIRAGYGISGTCHALAGERDLNLRVDTDDQPPFLFKIWNHGQDPGVIDLQIRVLQHLQRQTPKLPVTRVIPDLQGQDRTTFTATDGLEYTACLLSWLEGDFLREVRMTPHLADQLGRTLARLDQSLARFSHGAAGRDMIWDVSRTHRLGDLLPSLQGTPAHALAEKALLRFEQNTLPVLRQLPRQVIHADFNLDNILIAAEGHSRVCGIIDFGDALAAPRVCDLAIACAYQLTDSEDPLEQVVSLVSGYNEVSPLSEPEWRVLPGLIRARLVGSLVITSHMAALHPENQAYLLLDTRAAEARLRQMEDLDDEQQTKRLIAACQQPGDQKP